MLWDDFKLEISHKIVIVLIAILAIMGVLFLFPIEKYVSWKEVCVEYSTFTKTKNAIEETINIPARDSISRSFDVPPQSNIYIFI